METAPQAETWDPVYMMKHPNPMLYAASQLISEATKPQGDRDTDDEPMKPTTPTTGQQ